jgi:hypothetical protein
MWTYGTSQGRHKMTLERGFRRLTIVLSVAVLCLGVMLDALFTYPSRATVQVTLDDGRQFTLERQGPNLTDRDSLFKELLDRGEIRSKGSRKDPVYGTVERLTTIAEATIVHRAAYWWWTDTVWAKVAGALVALLWIGFFTLLWIARGFTGT